MTFKIKLGLTLFGIGLLGVLSMLTVTIPLDNLPKELVDKFSPDTIKLLTLINPTILLLIAVIIGTVLSEKVKLTVPIITAFLKSEKSQTPFSEQLKYGVMLGLLTGILTIAIASIFNAYLPQEFIEITKKMEITPIARFAYGGLTEELMMRFGFMTFVVWIVHKISKELTSLTYWMGIILATILFAIGHFPVAYNAVGNPSILLLSYILIGNSTVGIFFGWLYWKKGLEAAFVGHIFAHVAMLLGEQLLQL